MIINEVKVKLFDCFVYLRLMANKYRTVSDKFRARKGMVCLLSHSSAKGEPGGSGRCFDAQEWLAWMW